MNNKNNPINQNNPTKNLVKTEFITKPKKKLSNKFLEELDSLENEKLP